MSGWDQYDNEANSGGSFVKLNIGDTRVLRVLDCRGVHTKTWDDGKTSQMVAFDVVDRDQPTDDGEPRTLDCPVRRAAPLGDLRRQLAADGVDMADRWIKIECYGQQHPTKPGRRIGRWRCEDVGAATGAPAAAAAPANVPADGYDGAHETAILTANSVEAVGAAYTAAYRSTVDEGARARYREAATARKTEILDMQAAGAGDGDIPNF